MKRVGVGEKSAFAATEFLGVFFFVFERSSGMDVATKKSASALKRKGV